MNSYGFVEMSGVTAAVDALDIMCKAADVHFVTWQKKLGGRLVTVVVEGNVASVTEAVEAAKQNAITKPRASLVIANPHPETVRIINLTQ